MPEVVVRAQHKGRCYYVFTNGTGCLVMGHWTEIVNFLASFIVLHVLAESCFSESTVPLFTVRLTRNTWRPGYHRACGSTDGKRVDAFSLV